MSTASVRDVCADILDGLAEHHHEVADPWCLLPEATCPAAIATRGAETLRWTEAHERGESVEAMRDEIEHLREQVEDCDANENDVTIAEAERDDAVGKLNAAQQVIETARALTSAVSRHAFASGHDLVLAMTAYDKIHKKKEKT
jgi:acyl-CoA reductase-like NAD-dependent aldehyde dehydrogenase